ncbi:Uncharacterised protein [Klebsiella pneumoniae]|nr:Uncharacterised protein [Klebsiella pneumoniae]
MIEMYAKTVKVTDVFFLNIRDLLFWANTICFST